MATDYQVMPDLSADEYAALKADIAARGMHVPIEEDEHGIVLDGHHRVRAWRELQDEGVALPEYPRIIRTGFTDQEKRAHARALNLARRHLSQEQRRGLIADQLRDTPELSNRQIGRSLGVNHETVQAVRTELVSIGEIRQYPTVETSDGRQYPAQRRPSVIARTTKEAERARSALPWLADDESETLYTSTEIQRIAKEAQREERRDENAALVRESPRLAELGEIFPTIVLDPPWDWGDEGDVDQFGRARPTYDTMSIDEIAALPLGDIAEQNAHVYLWITNRSLPKGFALLEMWGFRYVTALTWVKPHFGMGNYFRGQTEHVLFGVRGNLPLLRNDRGTVIEAPRAGPHSAKPDAFYELVQECSPGPWLEMFSRNARPGWVGWGAEA